MDDLAYFNYNFVELFIGLAPDLTFNQGQSLME
jgi:hypothetical protein